jgi:hypothetical protein
MAKGPRHKKSGTPMSGVQETPERKKRRAKARKRQDKRWAAKSGPVKIYYRDPVTGEEREKPPSDTP